MEDALRFATYPGIRDRGSLLVCGLSIAEGRRTWVTPRAGRVPAPMGRACHKFGTWLA